MKPIPTENRMRHVDDEEIIDKFLDYHKNKVMKSLQRRKPHGSSKNLNDNGVKHRAVHLHIKVLPSTGNTIQ